MGTSSEFQMIIASLLLLVGCDDTTFNGHSVEGDTIVAVLDWEDSYRVGGRRVGRDDGGTRHLPRAQ